MKKIAVIGSGTMGNGIAHVFAQTGHQVNLVDIDEKALEKGYATIEKNLNRQLKKEKITEEQKESTLKNITTTTGLKEGVQDAELVVEAATESEELKLKIFKDLDQYSPDTAILASNTSSISITRISGVTSRPGKIIGMHFMNPVPVMKLVEIICGYSTSGETTQTIVKTTEQLGKVPVEANDYPGFVANRILMPMINEAIYSLWQGVAGIEEIDTVMKLGMSHPMGPLQLADFIGLDVCHSILNVLYEGLGGDKYSPCPLLVKMVNAGKLGIKTGEGFYDYSKDPKHPEVSARF